MKNIFPSVTAEPTELHSSQSGFGTLSRKTDEKLQAPIRLSAPTLGLSLIHQAQSVFSASTGS